MCISNGHWLIVLLSFSTANAILTSNLTGSPCLGETVILTCSVMGDLLQWESTELSGRITFLRGFSMMNDTSAPIPGFTVTVTALTPTSITSTLLVDTNALHRSVIEVTCVSVGTETIRIAENPSPPLSIGFSILSRSVNDSNVSIHWSLPTDNGGREDLSYTVTISPPAQFSAAVVTSTSVAVTDADYNVDYTVSVVASNCAGNSSIAQYNFRVTNVTCDPPSPPANGSILDNVNGSSSEGAIIYYRCDNGLIPVENQSSICGSNGTWSPNPQDAICSPEPFNCSLPEAPCNGFVVQGSNILTIEFGCNEGFFPQQNKTAICVAMDQWSALPEEILCTTRAPSGAPICPSIGGVVGITFTVTAVVFTILGILIGLLLMYLILTHKKLKTVLSPTEGEANVQSSVPAASPVYDDVLPAPKEEIELTPNNAYGPIRQ